MKKVMGSKLFELTSDSESRTYASLKDYFEQMYFAN